MIKKIIAFILLALLSIGIFYYSSGESKFKKEEIQEVVTKSLGLPEEERLDFILKELSKKHNIDTKPTYHVFWGGGAFGMLGILYASLNEYLIVFGCNIENGGHTGRYLMTVRDFPYRGKIIGIDTKSLKGTETNPGESAALAWGEAGLYKYDKNTWVIEHAHGLTLSGLPIMLLGTLVTTDVVGTLYLTYDYFKAVLKSVYGNII